MADDELLIKIKKMGFNTYEDFIRKNFDLLNENQKKLANLIGISKEFVD